MGAGEAFQRLLRDGISPVLKQYGYRRKALTFHLSRHGNWGVLNFQKSRKSTSEVIYFTLNLGVASAKLLVFSGSRFAEAAPALEDCHWRERLGFLLPEHQDKWWTIDANSSVPQLADEFRRHLQGFAVPTIEKYIADEALRDLWLSGASPGLTEVQRLMNLSVLLGSTEQSELLSSVLGELERVSRGKPTAAIVYRHIQRLKEKFYPIGRTR